LSAFWGVARFSFGTRTAWLLAVPVAVVVTLMWIAVPLSLRRRTSVGRSTSGSR
jgi:hypothetical protein